jgi:hypothetical protein
LTEIYDFIRMPAWSRSIHGKNRNGDEAFGFQGVLVA